MERKDVHFLFKDGLFSADDKFLLSKKSENLHAERKLTK